MVTLKVQQSRTVDVVSGCQSRRSACCRRRDGCRQTIGGSVARHGPAACPAEARARSCSVPLPIPGSGPVSNACCISKYRPRISASTTTRADTTSNRARSKSMWVRAPRPASGRRSKSLRTRQAASGQSASAERYGEISGRRHGIQHGLNRCHRQHLRMRFPRRRPRTGSRSEGGQHHGSRADGGGDGGRAS